MNQIVTILVTGAGGFVGHAVTSALKKAGYRVRTLVRRPSGSNDPEEVCGDITNPDIVAQAVRGCDAVIHLAARKSDEKDSESINVEGTRLLVEHCKKNNVQRLVNVSTQSVRLQKRGVYGQTKLAAEHIATVSGLNVITLRPSVIYDDDGGGIFSTLLNFLQLPVVPMIGNGAIHIRPIHKDDLALIIAQSLSRGSSHVMYDIGGTDSVSLMELTCELQKRLGIQKRILKIPLPIAMLIARITGWMPKPPITVSNVLGAMEDLTMDIEPMRRDFGITPRSLKTGLDAICAKKKQMNRREEAVALLQYAFSGFGTWHPSDADILSYEKALTVHGVQNHLLDASVIRRPWLLGALDATAHPASVLRKKILIAAAIGECSPSTAHFTLPHKKTLVRIIGMCIVMTARSVVKYTVGFFLKLTFPSFTRRNAGR